MSESIIQLYITGIALDNNKDVPVVILEDKLQEQVLPVPVGPFEANAIIVMLKGITTPRMLTHELFAHFMLENRFNITKLILSGKPDTDYKATLFYKRGRKKRLLDVRPSDGIALSLQFHNPVYAEKHLLQSKNGILSRLLASTLSPADNSLFIEKEKRDYTLM